MKKKFIFLGIIIIILGIIIFFILKKIFILTKLGKKININNCLQETKKIITDNKIKPIITSKYVNRPFHEFIVFASHNSFLPCMQHLDNSSVESIKYALMIGCRVIELDIYMRNYKKNDYEPVVVHGQESNKQDLFTTTQILFSDCIDTIIKYGFNTSDPLIILLELNIHKNIKCQQRMVEIIKTKLNNKLLSSKFKLKNKIKNFIDEPLVNLLNKIIFIAEYGINRPLLEILDGSFLSSRINNNSSNVQNLQIKKNTVQRIYPAPSFTSIFSYNINPINFWKKGVNFVAANIQKVDNNLLKHIIFFKKYSFIHKSLIKIDN